MIMEPLYFEYYFDAYTDDPFKWEPSGGANDYGASEGDYIMEVTWMEFTWVELRKKAQDIKHEISDLVDSIAARKAYEDLNSHVPAHILRGGADEEAFHETEKELLKIKNLLA